MLHPPLPSGRLATSDQQVPNQRMDGWTDRRMDGQMDGRMDGSIVRCGQGASDTGGRVLHREKTLVQKVPQPFVPSVIA